MAQVEIHDGVLHIRLSVGERMLAVHGRDIEVPLAQITSVSPVSDILAEVRGMKLPGAGVPGVVAIGTWRGRAGDEAFRDFVLVHHGGGGVVVSIAGGSYDRVLLSAAEPEEFARALHA